jgi:hypothetical protein
LWRAPRQRSTFWSFLAAVVAGTAQPALVVMVVLEAVVLVA